MPEHVGASLWDNRHGSPPIHDYGTVALPATKRIRPRPVAISLNEAIAYRNNPPTVLVRTARNINELIDGVPYHRRLGMDCQSRPEPLPCPFAKVGDVLYLREAWSTDPRLPHGEAWGNTLADQVRYRADWLDDKRRTSLWHASASMPLWATRNLRKVTAIKCMQAWHTTLEQRAAAQLAMPHNFDANGWPKSYWYYAAWCWVITLDDVKAS